MTDAEFARAFDAGAVAPADFSHVAHMRVAWVYLREAPSVDAALERMRDGITRFAAAAGQAGKYHETITVVWVRLLADVMSKTGGTREFSDVLREYPSLADKDLPLAYYSRARLFSEEARRAWVPPETGTLTVLPTAGPWTRSKL